LKRLPVFARASRSAALAVAALTLASPAPAVAGEPAVVRLEAVGAAFRATLSDGSVKQGAELTGAMLVFNVNGAPLRVRIAAVSPDPDDRSGALLLHDFRVAATGEPLCAAGPDGKRLGFPLAGRTTADGRWSNTEPGTFELVCTAGAQGKCVRFGYQPWTTAPDGRPMRDYYNACVRMVRADYCGDNRPWTRNGTAIDLWDRLGIQTSDSADDATYSFEAGWGPDGAVCVARTRIPETVTLASLKHYCPRLAAAPACDQQSARAAGALLFNRSRP
jgi:hypothetical protein